jgi:catechol 2,3-dioxygenase-like lactoylglutathione lyase family enzyme
VILRGGPDCHQTDGGFDEDWRCRGVLGDQERARAFYTEVLGLQVKDDAPYDEGARWLTVVSPQDLDGTELLLAPVSNEAAALQAARAKSASPRSPSGPRTAVRPIANS